MAKAVQKMVEVTSMDSGKTHRMTKREFIKTFGATAAQQIIAGEWPHIVAVEV